MAVKNAPASCSFLVNHNIQLAEDINSHIAIRVICIYINISIYLYYASQLLCIYLPITCDNSK